MCEAMTGLADITAVILAGGRGERLQPVLPNIPKVLAPVLGRPYLSHLMDRLAGEGILDVVLCTGYGADQVMDHMGKSYRTMTLTYSEESRPLGTAGALKHALPLIKSRRALVLNGDSYFSGTLDKFFRWSVDQDHPLSMMLYFSDETKRFGRVSMNSEGRITRFHEKDSDSGPGWINAGIYSIKKDIIAAIPEGECISLEQCIIPSLIDTGIYGFPCEGRFIDIGTPDSYALADHFFKDIHYGH